MPEKDEIMAIEPGVLSDFDVESGSEKEFLLEHLQYAPAEAISDLLSAGNTAAPKKRKRAETVKHESKNEKGTNATAEKAIGESQQGKDGEPSKRQKSGAESLTDSVAKLITISQDLMMGVQEATKQWVASVPPSPIAFGTLPEALNSSASQATKGVAANSKRRRRRDKKKLPKSPLEDAMDVDSGLAPVETERATIVDPVIVAPMAPVSTPSEPVGKPETGIPPISSVPDDKPVNQNRKKRGRRTKNRNAEVKAPEAMDVDSTTPILQPIPKPETIIAPISKVLPSEPADQKKRRFKRNRNSEAKIEVADPTNADQPVPATSVPQAMPSPVATKPVAEVKPSQNTAVVEDDGFVDLRAPKKKRRARKSKSGDGDLNSASKADAEVKTDAPVIATQPEAKPAEPVREKALEELKSTVAQPEIVQETNVEASDAPKHEKKVRKRAKKSRNAENQTVTATETPVSEAGTSEPKKVESSKTPILPPSTLTSQPLSEIEPRDSQKIKRKRGRKSSGGGAIIESKPSVETKVEVIAETGAEQLKENHS
jgi:hypothetical protein